MSLDLWEEIDKLDVSGEEQSSGAKRAQVVLRVEKPELNQGRRPLQMKKTTRFGTNK